MVHTYNSCTYDWQWVLSNVNCITRRMMSLISGARIFHSDWFEGYTLFSPTPPPRIRRFTLNNGSLT